MNDDVSKPTAETVAVCRAIRFSFAAVVIGMSYLNIRLAMSLPAFATVFSDMLGGKPLAPITALVLKCQPPLFALSILIPVAAVGAIFVGRLAVSIYLSGILVLAVFFQLFFTWQAMCAPLLQIVRGMTDVTTP